VHTVFGAGAAGWVITVGNCVNRWHFDLLAQPPTIPLEKANGPLRPQSLDVVLLHRRPGFLSVTAPRCSRSPASGACRRAKYASSLGFNPWSSWGLNHFAGRRWLSGGSIRQHRPGLRLAELLVFAGW